MITHSWPGDRLKPKWIRSSVFKMVGMLHPLRKALLSITALYGGGESSGLRKVLIICLQSEVLMAFARGLIRKR